MRDHRSPLVDIAWLASHLGSPLVRVADVRWYLAGKRGVDEYARGHIPGAAFIDVDAELARPRGEGPGRHPLPSAESFAHTLARLGATRETTVVAYDDAGGAIAARLWWLFGYFGLDSARVLDGGIGAWVSAGHELSVAPFAREAAPPLHLTGGHRPVADKHAVRALLERGTTRVLDARARDRFEGKSEPIDARPGHIPGARSAPFIENLTAPGGSLLPSDALASRYRRLGALEATEVVCYCGSGVTACHDVLALALAGRSDAILYEGSWSDWASDPSLPAANGAD